MTHNDLKKLVKSIVLNEVRSREKIVPTGAALRMAADVARAKQAEMDAQKAADDAELAKLSVVPTDPIEKHIYQSGKFRSKFNNIMHRINDLNSKISAIDDKIAVFEVEKNNLNMQRMEELNNLKDLNVELKTYTKSPK